jgi:murein DD-endopeptidase MepM/ murein hydrolase activator NlpD
VSTAILIFLFVNGSVFAKPPLVKTSNVPGGIIIQTVPCHTKVYFHGNRVMTLKNHKQCLAIVGIPLTAKTDNQKLIVKTKDTQQTIPLSIQIKKYAFEDIIIKQRKTSKPNKEIIARLKRERKLIQTAFCHWRNKNNINLKFRMPLKGRISSYFGMRRLYNGKMRKRHLGVDIAAKAGTPIKAPASGIVINTGNYLLLGKAIFIDHGQNLITVYCHLSKILVKPKQHIKCKQIIGLVGSTGRSTGPHLHWGVSLNNTRVNPLLLV